VLGTEPQRGGRAWRARIGLVLQSTSLDPQLTVREAIALYARMFANPFPVDAVLDMVELVKDADTRIGALSGGQRRRADLGLGIVGRPEVLFLDEPTTGLDPEARRATWSSVANLAASGSTVLMTTHYLDEAQQLAERIIVLAEGRVVADSTPDELRTSNSSPLVHYRVPDGVDVTDLPIGLAEYFDATTRQLSLRTSNVTATLTSLTSWARDHDLDLAGVEVGPPSLEDAYLALTARHHAENENGGSR
jgi:ABC-2 type transport system ATP-binding protein